MKTKLILLVFFLTILNSVTFSQPEESEVPLFWKVTQYFGNTRNPDKNENFNFTDSASILTFELEIINNTDSKVYIKTVDFPEKVQITILNKEIPAKGNSKIIISYKKTETEIIEPDKIIKVTTEKTENNIKTYQELQFVLPKNE
jgi:hypothetical protein